MKVNDDGTVKVLDFGLAKALSPGGEGMGEGDANSPTTTMTAAATKMGVIMGTAPYMSPEQAKGRQVDKEGFYRLDLPGAIPTAPTTSRPTNSGF